MKNPYQQYFKAAEKYQPEKVAKLDQQLRRGLIVLAEYEDRKISIGAQELNIRGE